MNQKGLTLPIVIIGLVVLAAAAFLIYSYNNKPDPIVTTYQEVTSSPSATSSAEIAEPSVVSTVAKVTQHKYGTSNHAAVLDIFLKEKIVLAIIIKSKIISIKARSGL